MTAVRSEWACNDKSLYESARLHPMGYTSSSLVSCLCVGLELAASYLGVFSCRLRLRVEWHSVSFVPPIHSYGSSTYHTFCSSCLHPILFALVPRSISPLRSFRPPQELLHQISLCSKCPTCQASPSSSRHSRASSLHRGAIS